jgi:hypothetical protein
MMDTMSFPIFSVVSAFIRFGFDKYMDPAYDRLVDSIFIIALAIELAYITHYGIMIVIQKSSENVAVPNLRELLYHVVTVMVVLALLKSGKAPLDALMGLRMMVVGSFTGDYENPGGMQFNGFLVLLDTAMSAMNIVNASTVVSSGDAPAMESTAVTLALVSDVAPQIAAGIMLLMNELMVRVGMALFPIFFYALLYSVSRSMFFTWFNLMFSAAVQMGVSIILIKLAAELTWIFVSLLGTLQLAQNFSPVGTYYFSQMQQSLVQACFGVILSTLLFWVPTNMASYVGTIINNGMLKQNIGAPVTNRSTKTRKVGATRAAVKDGTVRFATRTAVKVATRGVVRL